MLYAPKKRPAMISILLPLSLLLSGSLDSPRMCSCIGGKSLEEQFVEADLIFEGITVEKYSYPLKQLERLNVNVRRHFGFGAYEYVFFYATKVWKGSAIRDLVISTAKQESMCGYQFEEGRHYVVYAYIDESQPITSICTLTKPASEANEEKMRLNAFFEK